MSFAAQVPVPGAQMLGNAGVGRRASILEKQRHFHFDYLSLISLDS